MKRVFLATALALLGVTVSIALCQPPGGRGTEGRGPGDRGPGFGPPPNPIVEALDADGDHEISAQEIEAAAASLKKLDKNSDGKLTHDELHPEFRGGRPGFGPWGGPEGRAGRGPEARDRRGPAGPGPQGPGPGPGDDRGRPAGPPSPEQFVEDALRFDADQDGKLSKEELLKLAEQFMRRPPPAGRPDERGGPPADHRGGQRPSRPRRPIGE